MEMNKKYHEECSKISGLEAEAVYKALESDSEIEKVKEHALCMTRKLELVDDDGEIDIEKIKKHFEKQFPDILAHLDEKCFEKKADPKDIVYTISKCLSKYVQAANGE